MLPRSFLRDSFSFRQEPQEKSDFTEFDILDVSFKGNLKISTTKSLNGAMKNGCARKISERITADIKKIVRFLSLIT